MPAPAHSTLLRDRRNDKQCESSYAQTSDLDISFSLPARMRECGFPCTHYRFWVHNGMLSKLSHQQHTVDCRSPQLNSPTSYHYTHHKCTTHPRSTIQPLVAGLLPTSSFTPRMHTPPCLTRLRRTTHGGPHSTSDAHPTSFNGSMALIPEIFLSLTASLKPTEENDSSESSSSCSMVLGSIPGGEASYAIKRSFSRSLALCVAEIRKNSGNSPRVRHKTMSVALSPPVAESSPRTRDPTRRSDGRYASELWRLPIFVVIGCSSVCGRRDELCMYAFRDTFRWGVAPRSALSPTARSAQTKTLYERNRQ
jgi:hypothetical protein